jgi:capsular exopolysaccharide synthesis family protein
MPKDEPAQLRKRYLEGEIDDSTVISLMAYAMDHKLSGRLCLQDKLANMRVFFEHGVVVHTDSSREEERLGNLILKNGRLSRVQLARAERRRQGVPILRRFLPEKRFGEILLSMGAISRAELKGFLEYQMKQRMLGMFAIGAGHYEFHLEDINRFLLTDIPIQANTREILFEGIKLHVNPRYLKDFYDRIRNAWPIRLRSELKSVSMSLSSKDAYILTRLEGSRGIDDVLRSCNLPHDETLRTLLGLFCCDVLTIADLQRPEVLRLNELRSQEIETETTGTGDTARQLKLVSAVTPGQVPMLQEPHSRVSNSFRLLWAKLRAFHEADNRQVFCVTSGDVQEGKSFLAVNLALACAESPDHKVLLVDGDLHNPTVHKLLGLSLGTGLSDYLAEAIPDRSASAPVRIFRIQRLHVLTAGTPLFNLTELIGSGALKELLQRLRMEFQIIIVDTPPFLPLVDTKILTDLSDGILLSVRSGVSTLPNVRRVVKELDARKIIGFVYDDVEIPGWQKQYGHYYYSV